ncbi:MAG: hypothetical protein KAY32_14085 [Candidatus Eisenbacteria sp.]|nr:hypothetical protein [Candidatus Eisenbacteria bacterium]
MGSELLKLIPLAFAILFAYLCSSGARSKGHNPWLWGILGFFLGIFAIIVVQLLRDKELEGRRTARLEGYGSKTANPRPSSEPAKPLWKRLAEEQHKAKGPGA